MTKRTTKKAAPKRAAKKAAPKRAAKKAAPKRAAKKAAKKAAGDAPKTRKVPKVFTNFRLDHNIHAFLRSHENSTAALEEIVRGSASFQQYMKS